MAAVEQRTSIDVTNSDLPGTTRERRWTRRSMKHRGDRCVVDRDTPLVWLMCRRTAHIHNSVTGKCVTIISAGILWDTGRRYSLYGEGR